METPITTNNENVRETGPMRPVTGEHINATTIEKEVQVSETQKANETPEVKTEVKPIVETPVEAIPKKFFTDLKQLGVEVQSEEDLKSLLKEWKKVKDNPFGDVSPLIKGAIEAEKAGIPADRFITLSKLDYGRLAPKEVLFQKYLNTNPHLGQSMDFARKKFDKEFNIQYGVISKEGLKREEFQGTDQEWQQLQDDIAFAKESLAFDSGVAKQELEGLKARALTPEPQQPAKTPAELQAEQARINAEIESSLSFDSFAIPVAEGEFEVPITDQDKVQIRTYMQNPLNAIRDIFGIDVESEHTDFEKFSSALAYWMLHDRVGSELQKAAIEGKNKDIVINKIENAQTKKLETVVQGPKTNEKEPKGVKMTRIK